MCKTKFSLSIITQHYFLLVYSLFNRHIRLLISANPASITSPYSFNNGYNKVCSPTQPESNQSVSGQLRPNMRGRFKRKDTYWKAEVGPPAAAEVVSPGSPLPGAPSGSGGPDSPGSGLADMGLDKCHQKSPNRPKYGAEKRYLGVRVKMPVKDMLRNIRLAKGCDPQKLQRKRPTKSLEELAIIVEVLEEDLKTGNTYSPLRPSTNSDPSSTFLLSFRSPEPSNNAWRATPPPYSEHFCSDPELGSLSSFCSASSFGSPSNNSLSGSSDCLSHCLPSSQQCSMAGYHSADDTDDMIPSPQYLSACSSPGSADFWQAAPHPGPGFANPGYDPFWDENAGSQDTDDGGRKTEWLSSGNCVGQSSSAYFLSQLQREEKELRDMSDNMLLASDRQGRMALHRVVCLGKRAQGYAIAKRMATINCLDLKDSKGMTALHLAAKLNQHLMVADLIGLGANANEKDASGKTCLHLCAENGYIRVLEVLRYMMADGVFVDLDATDNYGLSVLQCAALGLSATVRELERSASPAQLYALRKEQMMETLECLLQMDSNPPTLGSTYSKNLFDVRFEKDPDQFMQGVKSDIKKVSGFEMQLKFLLRSMIFFNLKIMMKKMILSPILHLSQAYMTL
ncbi:NF-kappa-B inhibitor zeta [Merluccius polli]|uniref:NF-kappa-B inhibitor zeta n=1 Tax=Merluccius polli TaxID=89951 RepID=A0AA47MQ68_MERPO|nr:NF-kappa-B inhibitor zeta [Merluccius polli]